MNLLVGPIRKRHEKSLLPMSCLSVLPSVRKYRLGSHWTDFRGIWYWRILWNSVEKVQIWLITNQNIGRFTSVSKYFLRRSKIAIRELSSGKMGFTLLRYPMRYKHARTCHSVTLYVHYLPHFAVFCSLRPPEQRNPCFSTDNSDTFVFVIVREVFRQAYVRMRRLPSYLFRKTLDTLPCTLLCKVK